MITGYDYVIIAFYFAIILGVGVLFRRLSKNTSDYFRCGGAMPWWITGTSAWIAGFSAWTFVGAAGKVYETGTLVLWAYYGAVVGLGVVFLFTCKRFRRMRVVTWMEAVRARYGPATEQFYTWLKVPLSLVLSGVGLNAIGVFMSTVFGVPMTTTLIVLGIVITFVAFAGGAWAILASDFVQMFLVMTITIVCAVLTLAQPQIGGIGGLVDKVPSSHFNWSELARPEVVWLWILVQLWFKFSDTNNMENATMYLMAKSDRDARRMVLIPLIGSLVGPLIWFIPSMAATITHPDLASEYPALKQPHEAAFVAVATDVMPVGLLGLLLCAMLGATLTSMDAGLNKNVGVFVRSFYRPVINPNASEKRQLVVGKLSTVAFGALIVFVAVEVNKLRTIGLFDLTNLLAGGLLMPMALPLIYGMFFKRTPGWSAWSTALVGFGVATFANFVLSPERVQQIMGWSRPMTLDREWPDVRLVVTTVGTVLIGSAWYFATSLFYDRAPAAERARIDEFFERMRTPLLAPPPTAGAVDYDGVLYKLIGQLFLVFGGFVLLLMLIPNSLTGRLCFLFCGGIIFGMGAWLYYLSRRRDRAQALLALESPQPAALVEAGPLVPAAAAAAAAAAVART